MSFCIKNCMKFCYIENTYFKLKFSNKISGAILKMPMIKTLKYHKAKCSNINKFITLNFCVFLYKI